MIGILSKDDERVSLSVNSGEIFYCTGTPKEQANKYRNVESFYRGNKLSLIVNYDLNVQNGLKNTDAILTHMVFLNEQPIGRLVFDYNRVNGTDGFTFFLDDSEPICAYEIGVGSRFIFFYKGNATIGCVHHDSVNRFTIFADDDWYLQLIATYIAEELIYAEPSFSSEYYTPNDEALEMYDGNYISELLLGEDIETRKKYQNLIHTKEDKEKIILQTKKSVFAHTKRMLACFIAIYIFIMSIVAICDYAKYSDFIATEPYRAINTDVDCSSKAYQTSGFVTLRGLKVQYELNGKTVNDTIYVSKIAYEKYKAEPEFDFRVYEERDDNDNIDRTYYVGDVSFWEFTDIVSYIAITLFFLLLFSILIYSINNRQNKQ